MFLTCSPAHRHSHSHPALQISSILDVATTKASEQVLDPVATATAALNLGSSQNYSAIVPATTTTSSFASAGAKGDDALRTVTGVRAQSRAVSAGAPTAGTLAASAVAAAATHANLPGSAPTSTLASAALPAPQASSSSAAAAAAVPSVGRAGQTGLGASSGVSLGTISALDQIEVEAQAVALQDRVARAFQDARCLLEEWLTHGVRFNYKVSREIHSFCDLAISIDIAILYGPIVPYIYQVGCMLADH